MLYCLPIAKTYITRTTVVFLGISDNLSVISGEDNDDKDHPFSCDEILNHNYLRSPDIRTPADALPKANNKIGLFTNCI